MLKRPHCEAPVGGDYSYRVGKPKARGHNAYTQGVYSHIMRGLQ
jgi:hypothetical protein